MYHLHKSPGFRLFFLEDKGKGDKGKGGEAGKGKGKGGKKGAGPLSEENGGVDPWCGNGAADGGGGVKPTVDPVLAAIVALSQKMEKMVTKTDFEVLKQNIQKETKIIISEAVDPIKDELATLSERVTQIENGQNGGIGSGEGGLQNSGHLQNQVDEITEKMKTMSIPTDPKATATAIVIGGLTDFTSLDEASKWLTDILWDGYAPMPIGTYVKGKDVKFTGIFCANFSSPADRMKSLSILKSKLMLLGGKIIWADTDLPAKIRAPEQFLLALKKQLVAWDFTANSVLLILIVHRRI